MLKLNIIIIAKSIARTFCDKGRATEQICVLFANKTLCVEFALTRPHGQAVKTPPSHGGNRSSILLGGAK